MWNVKNARNIPVHIHFPRLAQPLLIFKRYQFIGWEKRFWYLLKAFSYRKEIFFKAQLKYFGAVILYKFHKLIEPTYENMYFFLVVGFIYFLCRWCDSILSFKFKILLNKLNKWKQILATKKTTLLALKTEFMFSF